MIMIMIMPLHTSLGWDSHSICPAQLPAWPLSTKWQFGDTDDNIVLSSVTDLLAR